MGYHLRAEAASGPRVEGRATRHARTPGTGVGSGYRYYSPELGRWINRDPIEERGGLNLYAHTRNAPIVLSDFLGMAELTWRIDVDRRDRGTHSGHTDPAEMRITCSCVCQKATAERCPLEYMLTCRIDAHLTVLVLNDVTLAGLETGDTFRDVFRHELKHVLAFFWFAEDIASRIAHRGYEDRCYRDGAACRRIAGVIDSVWTRRLSRFTHDQGRHALDPVYGRPRAGFERRRWDSYYPVSLEAWAEIRRVAREHLW